jgi:hypothetical protein
LVKPETLLRRCTQRRQVVVVFWLALADANR